MTNDQSRSPLAAIEASFARLTAPPSPLALDGCAIGFGLPQKLIPLDDLRILLLKRSSGWQMKDAVWSELVRRAQEIGEPWKTAAAGMMMPGLKRIAGQVARGFHGDIDDFDADILEGFFVGLNMVDPDKPKVYSSLRWMPLRYGVEARNKEDRLHAQRELTEPGAFRRYQRNTTGHQDLVLARAVGNGALDREDAGLVGCVRIDGEDLTTVSERLGIPYHQARKRLAFAEWRLAGYLGVPVPRPAA